jgi:hypothetical protein
MTFWTAFKRGPFGFLGRGLGFALDRGFDFFVADTFFRVGFFLLEAVFLLDAVFFFAADFFELAPDLRLWAAARDFFFFAIVGLLGFVARTVGFADCSAFPPTPSDASQRISAFSGASAAKQDPQNPRFERWKPRSL